MSLSGCTSECQCVLKCQTVGQLSGDTSSATIAKCPSARRAAALLPVRLNFVSRYRLIELVARRCGSCKPFACRLQPVKNTRLRLPYFEHAMIMEGLIGRVTHTLRRFKNVSPDLSTSILGHFSSMRLQNWDVQAYRTLLFT